MTVSDMVNSDPRFKEAFEAGVARGKDRQEFVSVRPGPGYKDYGDPTVEVIVTGTEARKFAADCLDRDVPEVDLVFDCDTQYHLQSSGSAGFWSAYAENRTD
jgi:hypothetical protein